MKLKSITCLISGGLFCLSSITTTYAAGDNTDGMSHVKEFYAVKGMTLQQTVQRWGQSQNTPIDVANLPNMTINSDKLYVGSLLSKKPDDNVIYQLFADNFDWQKANHPKVIVNNQNLPTDHYQIRFSSPLQKYLANIHDSNIHVISDQVADVENDDSTNNRNQLGVYPALYVNKESKVIAFSLDKNDQSAQALSIKQPEIYHLYKGQTVRQTIDRWAKRNGYNVVYQTKMDFNITQDTTLYGAFLSKNGPLQTLLSSLTQTPTPLKAEITANKVLIIKPDRYSSNFLMPGADQSVEHNTSINTNTAEHNA